jgi:hypothetical protein
MPRPSFFNKLRKNVKDASPIQPDEESAIPFSTTGSYGIETLSEPEDSSVE